MRQSSWLILLLAAVALGCRTPTTDNGRQTTAATAEATDNGRPTTVAPTATAVDQEAATDGQPTATLSPADVLATLGILTATPTPPTAGRSTATPSPAAATPPPPTATPQVITEVTSTVCAPRSDWQPHLVVRGDTVGALAACVGASLGEVMAGNCLANGDFILAGDTLWLPGVCAPPPPQPTPQGETAAIDNPFTNPLAGQPGSDEIVIDPVTAARWTWVTFSLPGFDREHVITLTFHNYYGSTIYGTRFVNADASGKFSYRLLLPEEFPCGYLYVTATDPQDLTRTVHGEMTVDCPTATPTAEPTATPATEPTAEPTATTPTEPTIESTVTPATEPTIEPTATTPTEPTSEPPAEPTTTPAEPTTEPTAP